MAVAALGLRRMARLVSTTTIILTAGLAVAGAVVHPLFHLGAGLLGLVALADLYCRFGQRRSAILRNFGLFGSFRYAFESVGPEFRQYWIANDTEEKPFSRRDRAEVYRYAKDAKVKSSSFGTLNTPLAQNTIRHSMFPLSIGDLAPYSLTFGEERGVKSAFTIQKPVMISAMSFGSLGANAVRALSRGAKMAGIPINTGEGGHPKHHLSEGADIIFQMGTAKFGVRNPDGSLNDDKLAKLAAEPGIRMIEIKFSQGAKPGKGGFLPAAKVTPEIADLRGVPVGKDVTSPARQTECDTPKNTVKFIRHIQDVSGLPVGIKFCMGFEREFLEFVRTMKRLRIFPDYIAVDGAQGGTGAAPAAFMDHVGMPLYPAIDKMISILRQESVRARLKVVAAGKLIGPGDQFQAFTHGADAIYSARGFMLAIGCIQALTCNTGNCPVGITTHDPGLQRGLDIDVKARRVANYVRNVEYTLKELLAATGCASFRKLSSDHVYVPELELRPAFGSEG